MDKTLRANLLKKGGKRELEAYNRARRVPPSMMNTGTRVHQDRRYRDAKHKSRMYEEDYA